MEERAGSWRNSKNICRVQLETVNTRAGPELTESLGTKQAEFLGTKQATS